MAQAKLNPYRFFDPDKQVRKIAYQLYSKIKDLPIISPHGHVDVKMLAQNKPFPDPAELLIIPDHYIFRLLYSRGVSLESLGIPALDGTHVETDRRKIWKIFAEKFYLFAGTPTSAWLNYQLVEVFGINKQINGENAFKIYDELQEKLKNPEFLPQNLFKRFHIEVLTTTDNASDSLEHHQALKNVNLGGKVLPCFRPDTVINITGTKWNQEIQALSQISNIEISSYTNFIKALENRRAFFKSMGATSTDHGVFSPYTHELKKNEAEFIFQRALKGQATAEDVKLFTAHMLMEMARMSVEDGLVMQIHPGSFRDHNRLLLKKFGKNIGGDIPVQTEYTRNLYQLLNKFGNDPRLILIVFTLDETTYSRELAPLAGHYPSLRLGPPWWFHDSIQGMTRFREMVTETASIYNTVGFNDDTRAFPSIPARHDLCRRIDANFLARQVARHIIERDDAEKMIKELTYNLVKRAYKL
jgi:glucuronate isomerase